MRTAILCAAFLMGSALAARAETYYAYIEMNQVDTNLRPLRTKDGLYVTTRFCLLWRPGWDLDNPGKVSLGGPDTFYQTFSYRVDPDKHTLTLYALTAPKVVLVDNDTAMRPLGGTRVYKANATVPMYLQPRPEWPCTDANWRQDLESVQYHEPSGGGGNGGWQPYIGPVHHTPETPHPCINHYLHPGC